MQTSTGKGPGTPIKQRLLLRFTRARDMVGPRWREALAKHDPFFDTRTGEAYMRSVAQSVSDAKRGHVDRIECVTLALECIAGIREETI